MVQLKYRKKVDSGIAGKYKKTSQKFENEKRKIQYRVATLYFLKRGVIIAYK